MALERLTEKGRENLRLLEEKKQAKNIVVEIFWRKYYQYFCEDIFVKTSSQQRRLRTLKNCLQIFSNIPICQLIIGMNENIALPESHEIIV